MELLYARKLLYDFVKQNYSSGKHLSKDNYLIVVQHSFRVENYAQQIANSYVNISDEEKIVRVCSNFS